MGIRLILLHAFRHMPTGGVTQTDGRSVIIIAAELQRGKSVVLHNRLSMIGVSEGWPGLRR